MSLALKVLQTLAVGYALVAFAAYLGQRRLMYFPERERTPPSAAGLSGIAEERVLETPDGERLVAWHAKPAAGQPTILYFHGNAEALVTRAERLRRYNDLGRGVFMLAYRGYGGSTGSPTEGRNVADAMLAFDTLVGEGIAPRDIVVYGESIGTGVATQLAAARMVGGLILDAPYTSTVDVGAGAYPYLPVRMFMLDRYENMRHILGVRAPILIVHGERDTVIPVEMGRQIYAIAPEPKEIATFPGAGHSDHYLFGSYATINGWIDRLRAGVVAQQP